MIVVAVGRQQRRHLLHQRRPASPAARSRSPHSSTRGQPAPGLHVNRPPAIAGDLTALEPAFGPPAAGEPASTATSSARSMRRMRAGPLDHRRVFAADQRGGDCRQHRASSIAGRAVSPSRSKNAQDAGAIAVIVANNGCRRVRHHGRGATRPSPFRRSWCPRRRRQHAPAATSRRLNVTLFNGRRHHRPAFLRAGPARRVADPLKPDIAAPGTTSPRRRPASTCTAAASRLHRPNASGFHRRRRSALI